MSTPKSKNRWVDLFGSLGWPVLLGAAASVVFYALLFRGPLNIDIVRRYFASHPVAYFETGLFFVGFAALVLKLIEVIGQLATPSDLPLEQLARGGLDPGESGRLLDRLAEFPERFRQSYFGRRLFDALEFVERKSSAAGLDDELKYLADADVARQQESYALVRIVIWATPMLGFLGTVIGITQALGDLDPQMLATDATKAMELLLSGLYVAFDTTALALTLSITLMFVQFAIDRIESQVLLGVDQRINELLVGRFVETDAHADPHVATIERMSQSVIKTSEQLLVRQTELWKSTIESAHDRWLEVMNSAGDTVQASLGTALDESLSRHADSLARVHADADNRLAKRWEQWQTTLSDNARLLHSQQQEMNRQGELLLKVVQATGEVATLEKALNDNLQSLAGTQSFEDTMMTLTAAIHLLNSRISHIGSTDRVHLVGKESQERAA
ncbi:MAG: MotA/TolQ/ExbB proton channel family protein [Planctomycetales bacterium]|nr:MotA/TolQ/ExbB proton channel family protein [Planctomycetales bacterium]